MSNNKFHFELKKKILKFGIFSLYVKKKITAINYLYKVYIFYLLKKI